MLIERDFLFRRVVKYDTAFLSDDAHFLSFLGEEPTVENESDCPIRELQFYKCYIVQMCSWSQEQRAKCLHAERERAEHVQHKCNIMRSPVPQRRHIIPIGAIVRALRVYPAHPSDCRE